MWTSNLHLNEFLKILWRTLHKHMTLHEEWITITVFKVGWKFPQFETSQSHFPVGTCGRSQSHTMQIKQTTQDRRLSPQRSCSNHSPMHVLGNIYHTWSMSTLLVKGIFHLSSWYMRIFQFELWVFIHMQIPADWLRKSYKMQYYRGYGKLTMIYTFLRILHSYMHCMHRSSRLPSKQRYCIPNLQPQLMYCIIGDLHSWS